MRALVGVLFFVVCGVVFSTARAGILVSVSDLISTSAPNATSTHIVTFTLSSAVSPSGRVSITPLIGAYTLQSGFDYTDVDVEVSSGGPFVQRTLAASPTATDDGISFSGASMTLTLNSSSGLSAGDTVRVTLGDASYDDIGDRFPVNPGSVGSYSIAVATEDGSGALDAGVAMIALVEPVSVTVIQAPQPPARVNGLPSGTVAAGNGEIEISFETNEEATCRYSTTVGVAYDSMTETFSSANAGTLFFTTLTGYQNNTTYTYYVRCVDTDGNKNIDDYEITFALDTDPVSNTSVATASGSSGSSSGEFPGGSDVLFLAGFELSGWAPAGSAVTILQDGVVVRTLQADATGFFKTAIDRLERGVYTFAAYARDSAGRTTTSYTTTLTLGSGTNNRVSDILLSPTLASLSPNPIAGEDLALEGESVPGSIVRVMVSQKIASLLSRVSATNASTTNGFWRDTVPGSRITKGSYVVQVRGELDDKVSPLSPPLIIGLQASTSCGPVGDINCDGKVNLTDFSIMLSVWLSANENSDLNTDGAVNLADFSILLFNWTG